MTHTQSLDASPSSVLALCSCGWRSSIARTRAIAWTWAHAHALVAHPGDGGGVAGKRLGYHQ